MFKRIFAWISLHPELISITFLLCNKGYKGINDGIRMKDRMTERLSLGFGWDMSLEFMTPLTEGFGVGRGRTGLDWCEWFNKRDLPFFVSSRGYFERNILWFLSETLINHVSCLLSYTEQNSVQNSFACHPLTTTITKGREEIDFLRRTRPSKPYRSFD